jgi:hypothetical protein
MSEFYMNKKDFAKSLGISMSSYSRLEKAINWKTGRHLLSIEDREEFIKRLKEYERQRRENELKKSRDAS